MDVTPEKRNIEGARLTIWRDAPAWNAQKTAAIGAFKCTDPEAGAALLAEACADLKAQGFQAVIGPMDGDTWHSYRLVSDSDGSPPFLMEPNSSPADSAAFEGAGFAPIESYLSARVSIADAIGSEPHDSDGITVTCWDGENADGLFRQVYHLSTAAFRDNLFYKPINEETFLNMYRPTVPLMRKELILFARNAQDDLIGYLFGIPNYAEGPKPQSVILKTYASLQKGVGYHLAHAFHTTARDMSFVTAIHALMHSDNLSADRSKTHKADVFRRYALMGRRLD